MALKATDGQNRFPIVGIGASAGGLEAFQQMLAHLPPDTGMAFLLVQHLDPSHKSQLTEILSRSTPLPVIEATDGLGVRPDHIYIIPSNTNLTIAQGLLHVTPRADSHGLHLPIDHLFRSLAAEQRGRAIGVVLSGTGSDGTLGLCEIKAGGGITFAQDEASAKHAGMPHSAIESGSVDFVLPPDLIARQLAEISTHPYLGPLAATLSVAESDEHYKKILGAVRSVTSVDFSQYRDTTIRRRIMRRMALHAQPSMADYARRLVHERAEVEALYRDLLINVTSFFRDPEVFESLKREVFPEIIKGKAANAPLRVWVPGCSTGQEAYSLAMALWEFFDERPVRHPIQIFATDLGEPALLERARTGLYPEGIEIEVGPERLRRFFKKEDHLYRIDKSIRDACVFARQNLVADPPFSHVDLISCRNLLIYLSPVIQKQVLPTFHYALNVPGFLVLGTAETVGENTDLFKLVDRANKIYGKKSVASRAPMYFPVEDYKNVPVEHRSDGASAMAADYQKEADRLLLGHYAPPGVLVNENFDILQFRGQTTRFLTQPPGEPSISLLKLAREGLFLELRSALNDVKTLNKPVRRERVRVRDEHGVREISLRVLPVQPGGTGGRCFLVLFEDADSFASAATPMPAPGLLKRLQGWAGGTGRSAPVRTDTSAIHEEKIPDNSETLQLRRELAATKEYLQSLIERQDAVNEELRSANEEVQSSNEELQSTNEELETAKEELQSTNEELTTVNEQLQYRNLELNQVGNDLTNLLTSTTIPVIMVGNDLRLRRITAPARRVMNLQATDIGRPLSELTTNIDVPELAVLIGEVIEQVQPREREVRDRSGEWYLLRIHPYRTADNKIDGAVLLLLGIGEIKRSQQAQRDSEERLHLALEGGSLGTWYSDLTSGEVFWDENTNIILGLPPEAERSEATFFDRVHPDDREKLQRRRNLREKHAMYTEEIRVMRSDGSIGWVLVQAKISYGESGEPVRLSGVCADISERKKLAEQLSQHVEELRQADQKKNDFIAVLSHELRNPLAPILNAVAILRTEGVPESKLEWCRDVIQRQVQHMVRLMDDLLDVGRIAHGKFILRKERVTLTTVINHAIETSRPGIDNKGQELTVNLPSEHILLEADPSRLSQVFSNLLNNAAKYTQTGGQILLTAKPQDSEVVVTVKDNGLGIASELLPLIFDLFVQGESSPESERSGLGLGLTLVRTLVELHGGTVEVRSDGPGRGSEFVVRLPIVEIGAISENPDNEFEQTPQPTTGQRKRILVVEDLEVQAKVLVMLLELQGHEVRAVNNGPNALKMLTEFLPDVALIDVGLPGMDGYNLAHLIREQQKFNHIVLIAQTGWVGEEDRERSRAAGFDHHLAKPTDYHRLAEILAGVTGDETCARGSKRETTPVSRH
jgi:two-component system CheB/CheR fusion protein